MKLQSSLAIALLFFSCTGLAADQNTFAKNYFSAWVETQKPNAKVQDLNRYLDFLSEDVGHQHLPYDPEASRSSDNKAQMYKGMNFYLGSHQKYQATLKEIIVGFNVVIIKYSTMSEGIHPQTDELIKQKYDTIEVLEIENGKVSVIRKYSE